MLRCTAAGNFTGHRTPLKLEGVNEMGFLYVEREKSTSRGRFLRHGYVSYD